MNKKDKSKRGASGGNARAANLTQEQRKEIASSAAKARWAKIRQAKEDASNPTLATLAILYSDTPNKCVPEPLLPPATSPPPPILESFKEKRGSGKKRAPEREVPKVYGLALIAAEKDYVDSTEELSYHEQMVATLRARIPRIVDTIRALGGTINPQVNQQPVLSYPAPQTYAYPPQTQPQGVAVSPPPMPAIPMAHGGAIGGVIANEQDLPEDAFLRDTIASGPGWQ